ncbi:hypothetical protein P4S72_08160 [Vibrio sp. PP-XX7]
MKYKSRRWNNILILVVILFIVVLNLPTLIKNYLLPARDPTYPTLLHPDYTITAMNTDQWSLSRKDGQWVSDTSFNISPTELSQRWKKIVGTEISEKTYRSLAPQLKHSSTVEVWYQEQEEPQRITYYQLPQFWLLKNWQEKWIAVSVERRYLFPDHSETKPVNK